VNKIFFQLFAALASTLDLCERVAEDGSADAALIITPSFYKGQMTVSFEDVPNHDLA